MYSVLLEFTKEYLRCNLNKLEYDDFDDDSYFAQGYDYGLEPRVFAEGYAEYYRIERDNNLLLKSDENLSTCLENIFNIVQKFRLEPDAKKGEIGAEELFAAVDNELKKIGIQWEISEESSK